MRFPSTGLWQNSDFLKMWTGETISMFGTQLTLFALPIVAVLTLDASPAQMGLLGALGFAPFLIFSLFAGVWIDRLPRRPIMMVSNIGRATLYLSIPVVYLLNLLSMEYLYGVAFLAGICTVFFDVSYQAYLPALVERQQLVEGNSKLEGSRSIAQIFGPSLGGFLVGHLGAPLTLILDSLSFLLSALFLGLIRKQEVVPVPAQRPNMWKSIREGMNVVLGNPILRSIAGCTATLNLFSNVTQAVFAIYVLQELKFDPALLGAVLSVSSIGAVFGVLLVGRVTRWLGTGRAIALPAMMFGVGALGVPLASGSILTAILCITVGQFIINLANPVYNINQVSLRQSITPFELQGRMNASMRFIVWGTIPVGAMIGGTLGEVIGLRPTLWVGAIGIMSACLWILLSPVYRYEQQTVSEEPAPA